MNYVRAERLMSGLLRSKRYGFPVCGITLVIEFVPWRNLEAKFMGHFMSLVSVDYVASFS